MASKQLGKLRQWAGEVISSRDKTIVTDEFKELERDIDLRRQGLWKLHVTSDDYRHALGKKRESEVLPQEEKLLPIDALGVVMIQHGEEFGDESAFGSSLVNLGKAHCKIAALQESFAISFEDTFIGSIRRVEDEIKEYQHQRKKLESRRLSLDAAHNKLERLKGSKPGANPKKDRELKDAEEEYDEAKSRYEETLSDVRLRMSVIQENEIDQLRSLTELLRLEMNFVQQYMEVLREVESGWVDEATIMVLEQQFRQQNKLPAAHYISRSASSTKLNHPHSAVSEPASDDEDVDDDKEKEKSSSFVARAKSLTTRRKSDAGSKAGSRAPSRPGSRAERKRADSVVSAGSRFETDEDEDDKDKEKKGEKQPKRLSVTGWASSKVSSFSSIGRSKKEKEKFSALMEDQDGATDDDRYGRTNVDDDREIHKRRPSVSAIQPRAVKSKSSPGTPTGSPKISTLVQRSMSTQASPVASSTATSSLQVLRLIKTKDKVVVAIYDFNSSSPDELSFKTGDQITVTNEVIDGWWMGELKNATGKKGLFPSSYTKPLPDKELSSGSSSSLSLPSAEGLQPAFSRRPEPLTIHPRVHSEGDDESALDISATIPMEVTSGSRFGFGFDNHSVSDLGDEEHPFSDQFVASSGTPFSHQRYNMGQEQSGRDSLISSDAFGDDERDNLVATPFARAASSDKTVHAQAVPPIPPRRQVDTTAKRAPPPPPPRRINAKSPTPPPVPALPPRGSNIHAGSTQSLSSGASSFVTVARTTADNFVGADGLTYSPFDSPKDDTFSSSRGCTSFKQNPFKPKGMCSNCFQVHH